MFLKLTTDDKTLIKTSYGDRGSMFVSKGGGGGGLFPTAPGPRIKSLKLYIIRVGSDHSIAHRN